MLTWADDLRLSGNDLYLDSREPRAALLRLPRPQRPPRRPRARRSHPRHRRVRGAPRRRQRARRSCRWITASTYASTPTRAAPAARRPRRRQRDAPRHPARRGRCSTPATSSSARASPSPPPEPEPADVLVMESTYGQPLFRFPPWRQVADELRRHRRGRAPRRAPADRDGLQPRQGAGDHAHPDRRRVPRHAARRRPRDVRDPRPARRRRWAPTAGTRFADFHGPARSTSASAACSSRRRTAPRSGFCTRFDNPCRIIMTGWAMLKNAIYRYGVDHALPLCDHADFDELMELIDRVRPEEDLHPPRLPRVRRHAPAPAASTPSWRDRTRQLRCSSDAVRVFVALTCFQRKLHRVRRRDVLEFRSIRSCTSGFWVTMS